MSHLSCVVINNSFVLYVLYVFQFDVYTYISFEIISQHWYKYTSFDSSFKMSSMTLLWIEIGILHGTACHKRNTLNIFCYIVDADNADEFID